MWSKFLIVYSSADIHSFCFTSKFQCFHAFEWKNVSASVKLAICRCRSFWQWQWCRTFPFHVQKFCKMFFFFCVPGYARFSVRWVRQSPQSTAVSQPVPKASSGHPPDWAMSGVSSHRRWGRIAGCGWGFEDPCRMDIHLSGKFSVCGGGRGVDSVQFSV